MGRKFFCLVLLPLVFLPGAAGEACYENNHELNSDDRLNQHRFYVGLGVKFTPTAKVGSYYFRGIKLTSGEWEPVDEVGLEMGPAY
jgi:hypothetical protein